ncbi:MAG TPA: BNR-4 repeat-containing protein [Dongiaceae bacterium]|nr:BNR-4 repeat-containing protein [Dongiaceae bacterium]
MDHFAFDGATTPWHGNATYPAAFHDSVSERTWVAWEAFVDGARRVHCAVLDVTAGAFGPIHEVAAQPLQDDDHGVPAIVMDHEGYVHCFHGPHDDDMLVHSTAAANDPATWTARGSLSGDYTYPHPTLIDGTIYLFMRRRIAAQTRRVLVLRKTTSLAGGIPMFGGDQTIIDFGNDSRVYAGVHVEVGTDVHISATWSDYADSVRRHVYHFIYDTTDGSVRNADGSVAVAASSLPITLSQANASFRVVDFGTDRGDIVGFCVGSDGALHLAYARGSGTAFSLYHSMFAGGAWSLPALIGAIPGTDHGTFTDSITLAPLPDGTVALWYPYDPTPTWTFGGDMARRIFSGAWSSQETVRASVSRALARPSAIRHAHPSARVVFAEVAQSAADSAAGGLRMYLHGDGGLIGRPDEPPHVALLIDTTPGSSVGTDPHFAAVKLLIDTTET